MLLFVVVCVVRRMGMGFCMGMFVGGSVGLLHAGMSGGVNTQYTTQHHTLDVTHSPVGLPISNDFIFLFGVFV